MFDVSFLYAAGQQLAVADEAAQAASSLPLFLALLATLVPAYLARDVADRAGELSHVPGVDGGAAQVRRLRDEVLQLSGDANGHLLHLVPWCERSLWLGSGLFRHRLNDEIEGARPVLEPGAHTPASLVDSLEHGAQIDMLALGLCHDGMMPSFCRLCQYFLAILSS